MLALYRVQLLFLLLQSLLGGWNNRPPGSPPDDEFNPADVPEDAPVVINRRSDSRGVMKPCPTCQARRIFLAAPSGVFLCAICQTPLPNDQGQQ